MPLSQKLFGAESAKAYAGAGGLTWYFAVKPKPPLPPLGRGRGRPSKKRKTQCTSQHVRRGRTAGSTCGKYIIKKKTRINWGKGKHRDLLEKAIQDWRKIMADNIKNINIKGCCKCYKFTKNYGPPPQTFYVHQTY
jgi:hypothetical protein